MNYLEILDDLVSKYISLNDDDPCLCGSGKPFLKCHKIAEEHKPLDFNKIQKGILKVFSQKKCYFKDKNCSRIMTASHSIPRASLTTISNRKHILRFLSPNIPELAKVQQFDEIPPCRVGINELGIFNGFCSYHDNSVFEPLEKSVLIPTEEQSCLLLFRAICKQLYIQTEINKVIPVHKQLIEAKTNERYKNFLNVKNIMEFLCSHKSLSEIISDYEKVLMDIRRGSFENYSSLTIITKDPPPINCCSYVNPVFYFDGKIYQNYNDLSIDLESFSFTTIASEGQGFFHFCWSDSTNFKSFFSKLLSVYSDRLSDFLIQLIFAYSENHAFRPDWWESLSKLKQRRIMKIFYSDIVNRPIYNNPVDDFRYTGFSNMVIKSIGRHF